MSHISAGNPYAWIKGEIKGDKVNLNNLMKIFKNIMNLFMIADVIISENRFMMLGQFESIMEMEAADVNRSLHFFY